uniref:G-type lectin S-receptor-like serine/threonine-protein kinase RKS1 n=1 Tax=Populus alba TaxID=43335 RepID=A0A4U5MYM1_POPAL|nr:G-type lectin S-receptor-like serine/threonine-protein kinase RKS1 [Populus alba]
MLPNLKLGLDGRTGLNRFLTAWKSPDDPATCRSLRLNPNGSPQLFLYEGQIPRWRSGHCNGLRWTGVPILQVRINFNVSFVNNDDELTIMWGVRNRSIFSRLVADEPGSVQRFTWHEQIAKWDVFCLHGAMLDTRVFAEGGQDLYVRVDAFELAQYDKKSRGFLSKKGMLAGLVLPIADGVFFVIMFSFWLIKRKKTVWKTTYLKRISRHVIIFLFPFGLFNTLLLNFTVHHGPQILQTSASSSRLTFSSKRAQEDQLIDMVDNSSEDMQLHRLEAAEMMRVAIWCLQSDHTRRPSMSTVVKVLEGTMGVEADLDYCLQNATTMAAIRREAVLGSTTHFCHHYYQDQGEERSFAIYMWCLCFSDRCFTFSSLYIASVMLSGKLFN